MQDNRDPSYLALSSSNNNDNNDNANNVINGKS